VRDELGWRPGDEIVVRVVRVEGGVAILSKRGVPDGEELEDILAAPNSSGNASGKHQGCVQFRAAPI
jgi:hypothetical protein